MIDAPIAFAFSAGLVAAFNPCGFAMLPAYLSFFLGTEAAEAGVDATGDDLGGGVLHALGVGAVVSLGFMGVFGVVGLVVSNLSVRIEEYLPWVTIVIGIGLVLLAVAMLRGFELTVALPKLQQGGDDRTIRSMFVFGVSYAVASLSCTLPIFLAATATTFRRSNVASGMAAFGAYALGMAMVLMVLTLAVALARHSLVRTLKDAIRYVQPVSAVLLLVAGAYVAYYGWFELRVRDDPTTFAGPADWVTDLQTEIQRWIQDIGPTTLGLGIALVLAVAALIAVVARDRAARADDAVADDRVEADAP
jgi:cytochrome c biogenesis protein CcdA